MKDSKEESTEECLEMLLSYQKGIYNVEILNNMTHIHRDYPDYTLISGTCIIHNLLYIDHQFIEAEKFTGVHRSINHTYQHSIFSGKASR